MAIADRINEMYTHVGDVYDTITNVDLPTNKNIQNIPSTMRSSYLEIMNNGIDKIWNNWEKATGSGTDISLSPTLEAPMKNVLNGNTYQFTTTGKNKLDTTGYASRSVTGITITPNYEGDMLKNIKVSGTPTATNWVVMKNFSLGAGTYILNGINISQTNKTGLRIGIYIDSSRQWFITSNSPTYTFTLNETTTCQFVIWVQSVTDFPTTDTYITPMIRLSSVTDSTYEPYTGGQASPNPQYPQAIHVVSGDNTIQTQGPNYYNYQDTTTVGSGITVDNEGWITCTLDNSSSSSAVWKNYYTNNLNLKENTNYLLVTEIKNVSGTGSLYSCSYTAPSQIAANVSYNFHNLTNNTTYVSTVKTLENFHSTTNVGIRTFLQFAAGQSGSITFRLSVLNDTTITANTFKYYPYLLDSYPINLPVGNLLPISSLASTTSNGITFTNNNDGTYTLNGTATAEATFYIFNGGISIKTNDKITFSCLELTGRARIFWYDNWSTISGSNARIGDGNPNYTTTNSIEEITKLYMNISIPNGVTVSNLTIKPMIEKGSKANSYTPYGTTPIELCNINTYKDKILRTSGKNLFDKSTIQSGDIRNASPTIRLCSRQNLWLEPGTYTFSTNLSSPFRFGIGVQNVGVPPLDSYPTYIYESFWQTTSPITFTIDSGGYCNINISKTDNGTLSVNDIIDFNYQLEKGSTATDYEPYGSGEWYKYNAINYVMFDGSEDEDWIERSGTSANYWKVRYNGGLPTAITGRLDMITNYFVPNNGANVADYSGNAICGNLNEYAKWVHVSIDNTIANSVTSFRTWLSTHNLKVYYTQATPNYTKITYEPLLEQLEAFYNAKSKNSQTNITQENNDLPFIIDSTMLKEV